LLDFLAAFFFAAIELTTFHAVRDLSVAPTWQTTPDSSGNRVCNELGIGEKGERCRRPSTVTENVVQFLAIIILLA
jgi:hypothetical protein